ncbi:MAG: hypothetical protein WA160_08515 [Pseudobdellovibrio sp.]
MEALVLKVFTVLFRVVGILLLAGTMMCVMIDIQKMAFSGRRRGLVSMLAVNSQLVGKTWIGQDYSLSRK